MLPEIKRGSSESSSGKDLLLLKEKHSISLLFFCAAAAQHLAISAASSQYWKWFSVQPFRLGPSFSWQIFRSHFAV